MEIEYALTPQDIIAFRQYHAEHPPGSARPTISRVGNIIIRFILIAIMLIATSSLLYFAYFAVIRPRPGDWQSPVVFVLLIVVIAAAWYLLNQKRIRKDLIARSVGNMLKQGDNAKLLEPQRLEITTEGITNYFANMTASLKWAGIEKIAVGENHAFFYFSKDSAHVVPKLAFADDEAFTEFLETAKRYREAAVKPQEGIRKR
jgi:YcxB-like protein